MIDKIKPSIFLLIAVFLSILPSHYAAAADPIAKWRLVKSVPQQTGGTLDFVLIPESKQRDLDYYRQIGDAVCGKRDQYMVFYWTNEKYIPRSEWFDSTAMQSLTGQYERHPNYREPYHLRLACWLYPSKQIGEHKNCFYMPAAKDPRSK
jgi:hypothetical protein